MSKQAENIQAALNEYKRYEHTDRRDYALHAIECVVDEVRREWHSKQPQPKAATLTGEETP